jgi:hypothetical protein
LTLKIEDFEIDLYIKKLKLNILLIAAANIDTYLTLADKAEEVI